MAAGGTINTADIYGRAGTATPQADIQTIGGQIQGSVASPNMNANTTNAAAFSWVAFVILLVLLRFVYEMSERS